MSSAVSGKFDLAKFAKHFDHHSPEYGEHLYDIYGYMRDNCPVSHTDAYGGFWVVTHYDDIMKIARDDETFSSEEGITIPSNRIPGERPGTIPIDYDPPRSKAFRRLLDPLVSPKAIEEITPTVYQTGAELVDRFIESGRADLVMDLARPLTGITTLRLAGIPIDDYVQFEGDRAHGAPPERDPAKREEEARQRMHETMAKIASQIERQRKNPDPGTVIAHLLESEIDGRPLEDWEIQSIINLSLIGGLDTTQALLGSAWVYLARYPERREELISNMDLLGEAIEEMLRYFAPQQALARTATRDTEVGGVEIKKGERVLMCWASANRDPSEFEDPDLIDFQRPHNRHMTFGVGSHRCMGSNLARLEARVCMEAVLRRLPDYALVEEDVRRYSDVGIVYGYNAVPVTFTPGVKVFA